MNINNKLSKTRRRIRTRSKIKGTKDMPRLSVFRSNRFIFAQLIDDDKGKTIVGVSEKHLDKNTDGKKTERAKALGLLLAKKAALKKIKNVVFDKGSYRYHGRIEALAQGVREGGISF